MTLGLLAYAAILLSPLPYMDDAGRIATGHPIDMGVHGRPLADMLIRLIWGELYTDASPATQILCIAFGAVAATILCTYRKNETGILAFLCATPVFLSPFYAAYVSFKFDSLFMGLACLLSLLPFLIHSTVSRRTTVLCTGALLACTLALYQVSLAFYTIMAAFVLAGMLRDGVPLKTCWRQATDYIAGLALGFIVYLPAYGYAKYSMATGGAYFRIFTDYAQRTSSLPPLHTLPIILYRNIGTFLSDFINFFAPSVPVWLFVALAAILLASSTSRLVQRWSLENALRSLLVFVLLFVAFLSIKGAFLFFEYLGTTLRQFAASGMFFACLATFARTGLSSRVAKTLLGGIGGLYMVWGIVFLSSVGNLQKEQYLFIEPTLQNIVADMKELRAKDNIQELVCPTRYAITTIHACTQFKKKYPASADLFTFYPGFWILGRLLPAVDMRFFITHWASDEDYAALPILKSAPDYTIRRLSDTTCVLFIHIPEPPAVDALANGLTLK